ncbi:MAG: hypothetical protein GXY87_05690 [Tissierellia bacterium]|nr:hypothetical protein [Tissierellia bacterium]
MKKLLSLAMALVMGLSMGAPVLAVGEDGGNEYSYSDETKITIDKVIKLENEGTEENPTVNPAETFKFVVGEGSYSSGPVAGTTAPAFDQNTFSIDIEEGVLHGSADINLPTFTAIGEYTYPITEVEGSTAGFVYNLGPNELKITVINNKDYDPDDNDSQKFIRVVTMNGSDGDGNPIKVDAFENEFKAGSLVINKEITGNYAVYTDKFEVTVTLTPDQGKNIKKGPITVSGAVDDKGTVSDPDDEGKVTITFKVTDGSTVTIANIPYDVSYEVTEASGAYTETMTNDGVGDIDGATQTVDIENKLDTTIETGVNLDNLPYILVLALVGVGLISFTVRKRVRN